MVDTIYKAFYPFHIVSCFLGCSIYIRHSLDHRRTYCLGIFYIITVWSIYAGVFYYIVTLFGQNRILNGFLMYFAVIINIFVTIISVVINIREYKKVIRYIKNLSLIDDTLEKLGTPKEYCKMRNLIKWILIIWFIAVCITCALDSFMYTVKLQEIRSIIIPVVINYTFYTNIFMDIIFIFWLRYIGTRFDKINGYITQLSKTDECGLRCTWKKSLVTRYYVRNAKNREHVLWTAMHLHLELCRIARYINEFSGNQMTLQMMSSCIGLIGMFYTQYDMFLCFKQLDGNIGGMKLISLINMSIWCGIVLTKVIAVNYICESTSSKMEKTKNMIHNLSSLVYFVQIREDICQFVLQISLRPLNFNGMGLFHFGNKFILKFIVTIISMVIFLVQMDNSPLSRILMINRNSGTCYYNEEVKKNL